MKPLKKENGWLDVYAGWCNVYNHYGGDLPWLVILTKGGSNISVKITDIQCTAEEIIITTANGKDNKIVISPQNQWQIKYGKTAKQNAKQIFTKLIGDNHGANHANPMFDST